MEKTVRPCMTTKHNNLALLHCHPERFFPVNPGRFYLVNPERSEGSYTAGFKTLRRLRLLKVTGKGCAS